ncbi:MAG: T9SS type A sorting domain-containing protein [Bacteroidota bacterium]
MKLKQKIFALGALVGLSMNGFSQFSDAYNSNTGWTTIGSGYTFPSTFLYFNGIQGNSFRRVHKSISPITTLTNYWRLDFTFQFNTNPPTNGIANWLAVLTAGTQDMMCSALPSTPTNQDHIGVLLQTPSSASPNNPVIMIGTKRGTTQALSTGIAVVPNTLYFVTLQRIGPGVLQMHVFSDFARTMPVTGSGLCFTTFDNATGTGGSVLTTLQHGGVSWAGLDRTATGAIDDVVLDNVDDPTTISANQLLCKPTDNPAIIGNTTTNYPGQFIGTYHWYKMPEGGFPTGLSNTTMDYDPPVLTGTTSYNRTFDYGCGTITSNMVKITVPVFNPAMDCDVPSDYTTTVGWTQTGTDVHINTGGQYGEYKSTPNSTSHKITKNIGNLPSDKWRVDFEFQYDPGSSFNPGAYIAAITNDGSDPLSTNQDVVFAGFGEMLSTGPSSVTNLYIWGGSRSDVALSTTYLTSTGITIIQGYGATQINYVSLERTCPTTGRISVFTDAARTIHAPGSPQYFTIDANVGTGADLLTTIEHANNIYYNTTARTSLRIDNLCVDNSYLYGGHRMATTTSIAENNEMVNDAFTVFPNPGTGIYTLSTESIKDGIIEIFDAMGRKVQSIKVTADTPMYKIDLSGQSKGIYIVNVHSNSKTYSKKIILE